MSRSGLISLTVNDTITRLIKMSFFFLLVNITHLLFFNILYNLIYIKHIYIYLFDLVNL